MPSIRTDQRTEQVIPSRLKHVCVVEPNEEERKELVSLCRNAGYATQGYESAARFLTDFEHVQRPCCVISELHFDDVSGREMLERLNATSNPCTVLFLSDTVDVATAVKCLQAGAFSVMEKPYSGSELMAEIGQAIKADDAKNASAQRLVELQELYDRLTPREAVILGEVLGGRLNKSIARVIDVSVRSVENYRARIYRKFEVESPAELAVKVTELRLLQQALHGHVEAASVVQSMAVAAHKATA